MILLNLAQQAADTTRAGAKSVSFTFSEFLQQMGQWLLYKGVAIFLILVGTLVLIKVVGLVTKRMSMLLSRRKLDDEYKKRADTLSSFIRNFLNVAILVVAMVTILGQLGIEIGPVLAAAGIVGLAVGFGAQSLVKDMLNGFFILLEDQIRVGDVVNIAGKGGLVEKVNLKMTVLRDLSGNVHFIPNGLIDVVTNMTKDYSFYVFDIGVAFREDVDKVIEIINQIDEEMRKDANFSVDILDPIEIFGLDSFSDSGIIIKARIKTRPIRQWAVGREFNKRIKKAFDEQGIEIPFPHRTVYFGVDKKGAAPPLHLNIDKTEAVKQQTTVQKGKQNE